MLPVAAPFTPSASSQVTTTAIDLFIDTAVCPSCTTATANAAIIVQVTVQATAIITTTTITVIDTITTVVDTAAGMVATMASEPA